MAEDLPVLLRGYRRLTTAATPFADLLIRRRLNGGKEDASRAGERKGRPSCARPPGPLVWIHGASVGEVLAVASLIERIGEMNLNILLTSGTRTSAEIAAQRFPGVIHQYLPYDCPDFVRRFLDHWQPSLALFIESDLWPNLILSGAERGVPLIVVNGRMSERSFRRWHYAPAAMQALLSRLDMCLAQSAGDSERFTALGSPHVFTTGNLKLDSPVPPADAAGLAAMQAAVAGRPVVIAASTHPGEEEGLAEAHVLLAGRFPQLLTVIVPRHAARGGALAQELRAKGLQVAQRSADEALTPATAIYLADTMGELGLFYRLSQVVFVGGSLVPHGGQNPIEAVQLGAAVVHGPHIFNFADVYRALDGRAAAVQVADAEALAQQLGLWLADDAARKRASDAGRLVVNELGGAARRTLAALEPYLLQLRLENEPRDA